MKKTALLFSSILFVFITGCATDYSLMDSDGHSTKQISPREDAHLLCLTETEEKTPDPSVGHDIAIESTGKCMRLKEYTLKNPLPSGVKTDKWGCPLDTDRDGIPDYLDECPETPECVKVDSKGCPLDTDGDGVPDYKDKCHGTPQGARVDERGCWVIGDAFFDFDKYIIKQQYYSILDEAAAVLKKNSDLKIEIQGHTCNMGTKAYNQKLSERRAKAIVNYFIKKGIDATRLFAVGYGLSKPKASNETEAGRILNRRVEIAVLQ